MKLGADSGFEELEGRRAGESLFEDEVVLGDLALLQFVVVDLSNCVGKLASQGRWLSHLPFKFFHNLFS